VATAVVGAREIPCTVVADEKHARRIAAIDDGERATGIGRICRGVGERCASKVDSVEVDELIAVRVRRTADAESGHPARIDVAQPVQDQPAAPVGQERDVFAARRRDKDGAVADLGNARP